MRFIPSKEIRPNVLQIGENRAFIPDYSHVTQISQSASTVWYNPHPLLVQLVLRQTPRPHPLLVQLVPRQNVRLHPLQQRLALTVAAWGANK
jgi:hypothetical protein